MLTIRFLARAAASWWMQAASNRSSSRYMGESLNNELYFQLYLFVFRLRTGWSAARSEPPLSATEREAIAAVVRRAEKVDEIEARRVGRLVARLEGMDLTVIDIQVSPETTSSWNRVTGL